MKHSRLGANLGSFVLIQVKAGAAHLESTTEHGLHDHYQPFPEPGMPLHTCFS
jgi:hypothetical protein